MPANLDAIRTNHTRSATRVAWDAFEIRVIVSIVPVIEGCGTNVLMSSKHGTERVLAR